MTQKFRKKPVVVEALQLRWDTWSEMCDFVGVGMTEVNGSKPTGCYTGPDGKPMGNGETSPTIGLLIPTLEGTMLANQGDWIVRGVNGEFYPVKNDIFESTYEKVE